MKNIITHPMNIRESYKQTQEYLSKKNINDFAFETRIIFEDLLNYPPKEVQLQARKPLTIDEIHILNTCIQDRITGKPLAYIIGKSFFWNNFFTVNEHTLIPRQDTETLIEEIIKLYPNKNQKLKILDLGTGSGCIILSLLDEYKHSHGVAVDICHKALKIAEKNSIDLELSDRITFIKSNWFHGLENYKHYFDIIVSNPPYIDKHDPFIDKNVAKFEPHTALYAKNHGLEAYEIIFHNANNFLKPNSHLILEIGWKQWDSIQKLTSKNNFSCHLTTDLSQNPRCVIIQN